MTKMSSSSPGQETQGKGQSRAENVHVQRNITVPFKPRTENFQNPSP